MATKRPERRKPAAKPTLMAKQDTVHKGDALGQEKILMTFQTTPQRRAAIKAYAAAHEMSVTRLIIEALEARMAEE